MRSGTNPITEAIESRPDDTSGLVTEPWAPGEIYGVAADWTSGDSPVWSYYETDGTLSRPRAGAGGWQDSGMRVADFCHNPRSAMINELRTSLLASGDDPAEHAVVELLIDAVEF